MSHLTTIFLAFVATSLCFAERAPNVIVFLTDDQGWGDLSINGNVNLATPHLDSLARDGAILENFYVCAVCAPTRAEFLTGRYHPQTGVSGVSEGAGRLNPDETTIAALFKSAGYATGTFGKWHNGTQSPYHPNDRGFDEFYGFTSGHWGHYFSPPLDQNRTRVKGNGYLPDDLTDHALEFIQENHDAPFFCYVPYNTPHSPFYIDDHFFAKFEDLEPTMRHREPGKEDLAATRAALAMCENIDWNVGRILKKIDTLNLREDTIIVYFSDNGPNSFRWNGGMKGKKGSLDEGGLRSPFLIRWPGKIPAGQTVSQVIGAIDLLPTLTDLAGIPAKTAKPQDGRSFAPLLNNEAATWPDRQLFSVWRKRTTVRTERFRMDDQGALFDIQIDRAQRKDVSADHPKIATKLRSALEIHRKEAQQHIAEHADRPFTVGFADSTTLPARDGVPHGTIQRSSKAPNNSFFKNWTSEDDSITWDIMVGNAGEYRATVFYTCAAENVGTQIRLGFDDSTTETVVTEAFDPPIWDKSKERVTESHYFVKDFKPLELGVIKFEIGSGVLKLDAPKLVGVRGIDVYSIVLDRVR